MITFGLCTIYLQHQELGFSIANMFFMFFTFDSMLAKVIVSAQNMQNADNLCKMGYKTKIRDSNLIRWYLSRISSDSNAQEIVQELNGIRAHLQGIELDKKKLKTLFLFLLEDKLQMSPSILFSKTWFLLISKYTNDLRSV